jgi:hypothetical protein
VLFTKCVATGYGLDGRGSIPGKGKKFNPTLQLPDRLWAQPASYPTGTEESLPVVKRPRRETLSSPVPSAEIKNGGAIPALSHMSSWHRA